MRWAIAIFSVGLAMAALAGCASSANTNPMAATQPAGAMAGPAQSAGAATQPAGAAATRPAQARLEPGAAEPSVNSVERDDWERVTFTFPAGRTRHYPTYFDRVPGSQTPNGEAIVAAGTTPQRLRAALSGSRAQGWSGFNAGRLAGEPVLLGWDLVTWPVSAVRTAPWRVVTSPERRATHNK
jgi:hypothetical protein